MPINYGCGWDGKIYRNQQRLTKAQLEEDHHLYARKRVIKSETSVEIKQEEVQVEYRVCSKCGLLLPETEFSDAYKCKFCVKKKRQAYSQRMSEEIKDPNNKFHGTNSGYKFGCRCDACKKAASDARKKYAERKKKEFEEKLKEESLKEEARRRVTDVLP